MNINAKKLFEFFLVFIIFYGVYSVFDRASYVFSQRPNGFTVVVVSLLFSAGLLFLYSYIISSGAKNKFKATIDNLEEDIHKKDKELKSAFKVKKIVEDEAEESILKEEATG